MNFLLSYLLSFADIDDLVGTEERRFLGSKQDTEKKCYYKKSSTRVTFGL